MTISYFEPNERENYLGSTKTTTGGYVSVIDYYDEDEINNVYCSHCWDYGIEVKLGPRILKPGEIKPADYEDWLECPDCGKITPIYEAKHESKIEPFVQPINNPFDVGTEILGTDSRATQRRKNKGKPRSKRFRQKEKIDPDIASEKGIVNILYDSSY